jgi:hypothetical protein
MLPINKKNGPCDPISSNCVVWQGPDLACVDICNGDSISAVIAGLCDQLVILQGGGDGGHDAINLSTINQTTLSGGPATTNTELIQLIIDNINGGGRSDDGSKIWDCSDTISCTLPIPSCYKESGQINLNTPDTLSNIVTDLMHQHCSATHTQAAMVANVQSIQSKIIQIERTPQGDPNPVLRSACVDSENTTSQPIANLVNKIEVDYCRTKGFVGPESTVLAALAQQPSNPLPLSNPINYRVGFSPAIPQNPSSLGESLNAAWRLIKDLRTAVEKLQADSGDNGILLRMVSIKTFFASGNTCGAAATNAATSTNCVDLWNSTGNGLDKTVKAYSEPVADATYELTNGMWYAQCPGSTFRAQYLGGSNGSLVAPFWTDPVENCG